jgi:hypothetical protein
MSGELEEYQRDDPLERAIRESGKQGLVEFIVETLRHYASTPESDKNFEDSMKFGARQGWKKFLHSFIDSL